MIPALVIVASLLAPPSDSKLIPELREAIAAGPANQVYRVYAVLDERMTLADLQELRVEARPRGTRQQFVEDTLRGFAAPRQERLLGLLGDLREQAQVTRVAPLWITNTVVFRGTPAAIEAVAALPEVAYVGWDPERPASEYWDVLPGGFTTYYSEDFESGSLGADFQTAVTGCGFVQVTGLYGPSGGGFHLVMASDTDSCDSTATTTLTVDLSGVTTAQLRYRFKDMNDEFTAGADILEASDDGGANWVAVADLTGSDGIYLTKIHDLDATGLSYVSDFMLRWRWSDNFAPETDGFGIDDIEIADGFPPLPPPEPEPNLVQLQAPELWALGFRGQGVHILNIDSGADYTHPDLVNRVWANPNDPVDGVDNDSNGYIDDIRGWDFAGDDNDPSTSATHGTNTAGIMVGDGSQGIALTGMAPEASMSIALISGESDHWLAQQWGISVGIDCSSSSHSYKWYFSPKPDYHMHRAVEDMVLAAGIIHANSIGNDGGSSSAPIPFNISAPGLTPSPWMHPQQSQQRAGVSGVMACGGILLDDSVYSPSGIGPSAWEDLVTYDGAYPHAQQAMYWDYAVGGFGGSGQGLLKPDVVTYTSVMTTTNGGGYNPSFGGTSAATPHLGGSLALLISVQPHAAPRHIAQALQITAEDLGTPGKDNQFGAGKVQVKDAALRLMHLLTADDLTPGLGDPITFSAYGAPGGLFGIFYSVGLGSTGLGSIGTLDIAPPATLMLVDTMPAGGQYDQVVVVPGTPTLVGQSFHFQSVQDDTGGPTGQYLFSTVETIQISGP